MPTWYFTTTRSTLELLHGSRSPPRAATIRLVVSLPLSGITSASSYVLKAAKLLDIAPLHNTVDVHVLLYCPLAADKLPGVCSPGGKLLQGDVWPQAGGRAQWSR
eukprot:CAMPEP_0117694134 /NCGR_PEP_ID=MMETSP0804-20121206/27279_1 /TAXON_ID=1074897 /ORGANISM="Tetraselmis astigmatica, Strain CCMP880" /LENGTH=104 /DNA_ID=CAMNT_0005507789 /DNA_START=152 /DNA_END=466 /DNA_ORIENTATION=-